MQGLLRFCETLFRISIKLAVIFVAAFVALIAALTWKK